VATQFRGPGAELDHGFDWAELGYLEPGETIIESNWALDPGLTRITSSIIVGTKTVVWVSGGVVGQDYVITNSFRTSAGRSDSRSHLLKVRRR